MLSASPLRPLALVLVVLSCCIVRASAQDADGIRQGDRWTYDIKDVITGELKREITVTVVEINEKEIVGRLSSRGSPGTRTYVFDPHWSRIDDGVWKFQPNDGVPFKKPLAVGQEWRIDHTAKNLRTGTALNSTGVARVTGQEKTTTSAGTFDTLKIEVMERQVQGADSSKFVEVKLHFWYAASVNRWVKKLVEVRGDGRLRDSFSEELTNYSRKP